MKSLQFTEEQYAAHVARIEKMRAEGRVRTVICEGPKPRPAPKPKAKPLPKIEGSYLEREMALQIRAEKLPEPVRQHRSINDRKFRADFAWPDMMVILECDGGVHRIKARFHADIERHNLLLLAGWRVLRAGRVEIHDGRALGWLKQILAQAVEQSAP